VKTLGGQVKHGANKRGQRSAEYRIWANMKTRCQTPSTPAYKWYGARGIRVCERWQKFENFYFDMGSRPHNKSLDRINNDGDYEPGNCRWADRVTQGNNTRSCVYITHEGKTLSVSQWARSSGMDPQALKKRLKRKIPFSIAISKPLRKTRLSA
jgi:hypothetical protein